MKMCLEIFGSLEITLHGIETFRYEAENDNEDNISFILNSVSA